jgi:hypothetical protein
MFNKLATELRQSNLAVIKIKCVCNALTREHLLKGRLSTTDLLIKIGCFVKIKNIVSV